MRLPWGMGIQGTGETGPDYHTHRPGACEEQRLPLTPGVVLKSVGGKRSKQTAGDGSTPVEKLFDSKQSPQDSTRESRRCGTIRAEEM